MGKNILLVEQDKSFCKLIVPVLEGRGHKVFIAESGMEGKGFIQKENLDMVILGAPLPDDNGFDWLTALRATGNKVPVTFIASSQPELHANKDRLERELGVVLAVSKPVIPFVFGAQLEGKISPDDAQSGKLKRLRNDVLDACLQVRAHAAFKARRSCSGDY